MRGPASLSNEGMPKKFLVTSSCRTPCPVQPPYEPYRPSVSSCRLPFSDQLFPMKPCPRGLPSHPAAARCAQASLSSIYVPPSGSQPTFHPRWSSTPRQDLSTSQIPLPALLSPSAGLLAGKVPMAAEELHWPLVDGGGGCSLGVCVG